MNLVETVVLLAAGGSFCLIIPRTKELCAFLYGKECIGFIRIRVESEGVCLGTSQNKDSFRDYMYTIN